MAFPDISARQGSVVLLTGPSGSGKSTWLAMVAALVAPKSGRLMVAAQDVSELSGSASDAWRAKTIGFLPQKLHLSAALSVEQNLSLAQWASGQHQDLKRVFSVLQALGVSDFAKRMPSQLSGGQAQRVALARAVLLEPKVILADEPTASLDDDAARLSVELLVQTAKKFGATLVIATHDSRVADQLQSDSGITGETIQLRLKNTSTAKEVAA